MQISALRPAVDLYSPRRSSGRHGIPRVMAEQVVRLRGIGGAAAGGGTTRVASSGQRATGGDEHRHLGPVTDRAGHATSVRGQDRDPERRTAAAWWRERVGRALDRAATASW